MSKVKSESLERFRKKGCSYDSPKTLDLKMMGQASQSFYLLLDQDDKKRKI